MISVVSPRILKREESTPHMHLGNIMIDFFGATKQVIVDLGPNKDRRHMLEGLKREKEMERRI